MTVPTAGEARELAERLGLTLDFFRIPLAGELDEETTHFRSKQSAHQRDRRRALAHTTLISEILAFFDAHLELPPCDLPVVHFDGSQSVDDVADACRQRWGFTLENPLENIMAEAERAGVVVVNGPADAMANVHAFSARGISGHGIIVLNPNDPPSRQAFNIAHELGHLIFHNDIETGDAETERLADRFASALLMPRIGFKNAWQQGPGFADLGWLLEMKNWWRVSLQALVRRACDLHLLPYAEYREFFIVISSMGWRLQEPGEFDWPEPEFLGEAFAAMENHVGMIPARIAAELGLQLPLLAHLVGLDIRGRGGPENVLSLSARRRRRSALG